MPDSSGPVPGHGQPLDSQRALDFADVPHVLERADFELYRDDVPGALSLLEQAYVATGELRYAARAAQIRSWLQHLSRPQDYAAVYERFYEERKGRFSLKRLERDLRVLLGRKTRKTVQRIAADPEFRLLDQEVIKHHPARVLDAGCGEGRVAITLGCRHPEIQLTGVDVSRTNIRLARNVNRFPNVSFHGGLIEEFVERTQPASFDLVYSFAVLEHVPDDTELVRRIFRVLRPGGRFCFVVPMNELTAVGPVPEFRPPDGALGHVRCFSESGLRAQFGHHRDFLLVKLPGQWRPNCYPPTIVPIEFGSFFVALTKHRSQEPPRE
ncbi:MAG: hypothetical protein AUH29_11440 [Candidatus Rokubacteria bacterium 13_1_40CM_69_27]|nr:MAG: hypothetical protein AUH29_11440 [Candidatus Rokubacteria bacterium 13_1_40CM_69_27]OLC36781.1 MAG: hypothetical protein AUH81_07770 [Candidatus Rokubacteria bacterium 13_1_40CM_4_69_5]OLE36359.1 MAG: hypothetical protein AUG00_10890 [Candidatus Rokubacteria bacterium 13_1_20CM_2_70_7]